MTVDWLKEGEEARMMEFWMWLLIVVWGT